MGSMVGGQEEVRKRSEGAIDSFMHETGEWHSENFLKVRILYDKFEPDRHLDPLAIIEGNDRD